MRWWEYSGSEGLVADVLTKKREEATVVHQAKPSLTHPPENLEGPEVGKKWSSLIHEQPACFLVDRLYQPHPPLLPYKDHMSIT